MGNQTIDKKASKHFSFINLIECGNSYRTQGITNLPKQELSWLALQALAINLLDPIVDQFGPITLSYGFCSPELSRLIKQNDNPHIAPNLDQHACHELNTKGKLICHRLGAAVDFTVDAMPNQMDVVAVWIAENLTFDRIYYYGQSRPLHISYGPEMNQFAQLMNTNKITGRRTPGRRAIRNKAIQLLKQLNY